MKICFVTGGTGGHIYPALALADKMKELDSSTEILFIGNDDRMEKDLIPQNGYAFKGVIVAQGTVEGLAAEDQGITVFRGVPFAHGCHPLASHGLDHPFVS